MIILVPLDDQKIYSLNLTSARKRLLPLYE